MVLDWHARGIQRLQVLTSSSAPEPVTQPQARPGFQTKRSLIEIGLEVGYKNPSHFAQVFRRVVGVTPTEFRSAL